MISRNKELKLQLDFPWSVPYPTPPPSVTSWEQLTSPHLTPTQFPVAHFLTQIYFSSCYELPSLYKVHKNMQIYFVNLKEIASPPEHAQFHYRNNSVDHSIYNLKATFPKWIFATFLAYLRCQFYFHSWLIYISFFMHHIHQIIFVIRMLCWQLIHFYLISFKRLEASVNLFVNSNWNQLTWRCSYVDFLVFL